MNITVEMSEHEFQEFKAYQASLSKKPYILLRKYDWVYDKIILADEESFNMIKNDAFKQISENRDYWYNQAQQLKDKLSKKSKWW